MTIRFCRALGVLRAALAVVVSTLSIHATPIPSDNFNDNFTDPSLWNPFQIGSGPAVVEQNGRVEVTIPGNSSGNDFGAGYISALTLTGDFDAQLDYALLIWPAYSGIRVGIGLDIPSAVVERTSFSTQDYRPPGDFYFTDLWDGLNGFTPTADQFGKLRITRTGNVFSGYYWDGQSWVLIHQGPGPTATAHFAAAVWGQGNTFAQQQVQVAFDNFQLTLPGSIKSPVPDDASTFSTLALSGLMICLMGRRMDTAHTRGGKGLGFGL